MEKAIIIAHYNEDLNWIKKLEISPIVYSKTDRNFNFINHNRGNEVAAYFEFIIDYFDNLPNKMLFLHGHENSNHQDFTSSEIANKVNWELDSFFSVNKRDWYQDPLPAEYFGWVKNNWDIFGDNLTLPESLSFYSSAQFVVDKELVEQYPLSFYTNLYEWIKNTHLTEYYSGRILEYTWHYIFTKNNKEKKYTYNEILK
jgi:hypothetical protein